MCWVLEKFESIARMFNKSHKFLNLWTELRFWCGGMGEWDLKVNIQNGRIEFSRIFETGIQNLIYLGEHLMKNQQITHDNNNNNNHMENMCCSLSMWIVILILTEIRKSLSLKSLVISFVWFKWIYDVIRFHLILTKLKNIL